MLIGCGESESGGGLPPLVYPPMPGCEHIDSTPCDTLQASCQQLRLELAACLRGSDPGELPPVTVWSEEQYAAALSAAMAEEPRPVPDHLERALSMLLLVEPNGFAPGSSVTDQATWIWGFYDPAERDITIIDHGQHADDAVSNALLVHELVHALQDRDVDLRTFQEDHDESFDAMLASRAIVEGEAQLHESHYAASLHGIDPAQVDWRTYFSGRIAAGEEWVLEQSSPLIAARAEFPYDHGQRFMDFAWQAGGHAAILGLLEAPPPSTQTIFASVDTPSAPLTAFELPLPSAPAQWTAVTDDVLGAWSLYLAIARVTNTPEVRSAALAWRGDRLSVYAGSSPPGATAMVWQLELADEASAAEVETNLGALVGSVRVRRRGTRVVAAAATTGAVLDWAYQAP
jgi:hypothetical protein